MANEPVRMEAREGGRVLRLSGRVDVSAARALHRAALEAARSGEPVAVDAGEVDFLGTAAFQVLTALHRRLVEAGGSLGWLAASENARAFAALGGFDAGVVGGMPPAEGKEEGS